MKRLIETIKNIFKIEELRKRILFTLSLILVYRFGSFVVIPGINPEALTDLQSQVSGNGLLGLLNIFSGGAFSNASIFARHHALHFGLDRDPAAGHRGSLLPETAEGGRERPSQDQPVDALPDDYRAVVAGSGLSGQPARNAATLCLRAGAVERTVYRQRDDRPDRRNDVRDVARREDHRQGNRQRRVADYHGGYHRPAAARADRGVQYALHGSHRWFRDAGRRAGAAVFGIRGDDRSGAGYAQDSRAVRQADRRQQAVRRSPSVYSAQDQCRRGHADHLRSGADVYPDVLQPFRGDERYRHRVLGLPRLLV